MRPRLRDKPGTIIAAEQVVDAYLTHFEGYRARLAAMDACSMNSHCRNIALAIAAACSN